MMNIDGEREKVCSARHRIANDGDSEAFCEGGLRCKRERSSVGSGSGPLVSIVTVCLNSFETIERCIDSVAAQSYENIEYIVIDGGSSDGTVSILRDREEKIDYFVSEPDSGLYSAMNKGLSLSSGEYIALLNSDDWYEPDCISALVAAIQEKKCDFVSGLANYVDGDGRFLYTTPVIPLDETTRIRNPLRHETMLISRDIYDRYGPYDERYKIIADFQFILKLYESGLSHYTVPKALMGFTNTGVSSTDMTALVEERSRLMKEQFPYVTEGDIRIIANLQKLNREVAQEVLFRNRYYKRFHESFFKFIRQKWEYPEGFIKTHEKKSWVNTHFRVETVCTNSAGGAGIGTQRRVEALRSIGIDVAVNAALVGSDDGANKLLRTLGGLQEISWSDMIKKKSIISRANTKGFSADEMFSSAVNVLRMSDMLPVVNRADVLHFHWMVGILDYENFDLLADKPIVWTLADMAAFTGGCHYSQGCEGYVSGCVNCKLAGENRDLIRESFEVKKAAYAKLKNLCIVCPSAWLAEKAKKSPLLENATVRVIPNPVPFGELYPINKVLARVKLGLKPGGRYILFGAENVKSARKGGAALGEALQELTKLVPDIPDITALTFGHSELDVPFPTVSLGYCSGYEKIRLVYSAADVFAFPSKEDNSPLTVSESLACGTPVVAFPVGNVKELIMHRENGFIAKYGDVSHFAQGLSWAVRGDFGERIERSLKSVASVRNHNDPLASAKAHADLYREMLERTTGSLS